MKQLGLFDQAGRDARAAVGGGDPDAEGLLAGYRTARAAEGAHPRSVAREEVQLRALVREASTATPGVTLRTLLADIELLARTLRDPTISIARSTGRARLLAVQRAVRILEHRSSSHAAFR